ncbi:MAG: ABC transporter permease [Janthinobacterium lividum]
MASSVAVPVARRGVPRWRDLPAALRRGVQFLMLLALWQVYVVWSDVEPLIFPAPADVGRALWTGWVSGDLARATGATIWLLLISLLIGVVLGLLFTVLARVSTFADDLVELLTGMLNPLPSVAMLPIAITWFGLNVNALLFVVVNAVVWPVTLNISTGFRTANPTLVNVGRVLGLPWWRMVTDVLFPAALPHTMTGIKTGLGYGWRTIIAAELVFGISGSKGGLGNFLNDARTFMRTDDVFAGIVTVAAIGVLLEAGFNLIERRTVVRWGMKQASASSTP